MQDGSPTDPSSPLGDPPPPRRPDAYSTVPPIDPGELGKYDADEQRRGPIGETTSDDRTMAMLCHLLALFTSFVGPLVIWLIRKDDSRFIDAHGREALNLEFSYIVVSVVAIGLMACGGFMGSGGTILFCPMVILLFVVMIYVLIVRILACVAASRGEMYEFPMTIAFFGKTFDRW